MSPIGAFEAFLRKNGIDTTLFHTAYAQRIAKYLSENMTYTLNPTLPETEDEMSAVERFLFVTKEGYCVQYATSATLLLRSLGIPTRYVEGYIASKFTRNEAEDRVGNYISHVRDSNAHAWCEIYLENYGWLTTEVTTPYYSDLYDPYENIHYNPGSSSGSTSTPTTPPEIIEEEEEEETFWDLWGDTIITAAVCVGIAVVVVLAIRAFLENRRKMRWHHTEMLKKAKQHLAEEDERPLIASALYDNLRRIAAVFDIRPMAGETPEAYTARLDIRFKVKTPDGMGAAAAVYPIIAKNEFGDVPVDAEELWLLADYIIRMEDLIRAEANVFVRLYLKYIRGLME